MALTAEQQALDFNPELQDVSRQRKLADLLMAQGMQQPQGQMISGYYVAPSFTQQLNPLANILAGQSVGERADTKQAQMAEMLRVQGDKAAQEVMQAYKQDPQLALAKASQYQQFPQVKALLPQLSKVALPEATTLEREFVAAKNQGYQGNINDFKNQMSEYQKVQAANDKQRLGLEGARLTLEQQKAAQELQFGKPLTESQAKATAFQSQMIGAENNIKQLESKGFNPSSLQSQAALKVAGSSFNIAASPETQQYKQAQEQWAEAYLRFKTGAAATEGEVQRNIKTFFPQFGDKPAQIAQKADARRQAEQDIGFAAGMGAGRAATRRSAAPAPAPRRRPVPAAAGPGHPPCTAPPA
jgi:hypothetical protein